MSAPHLGGSAALDPTGSETFITAYDFGAGGREDNCRYIIVSMREKEVYIKKKKRRFSCTEQILCVFSFCIVQRVSVANEKGITRTFQESIEDSRRCKEIEKNVPGN